MTTAVSDPNSDLDRRCKLLLSEKDLNFLRMSTNEQRVYIDEQKKELVRELAATRSLARNKKRGCM